MYVCTEIICVNLRLVVFIISKRLEEKLNTIYKAQAELLRNSRIYTSEKCLGNGSALMALLISKQQWWLVCRVLIVWVRFKEKHLELFLCYHCWCAVTCAKKKECQINIIKKTERLIYVDDLELLQCDHLKRIQNQRHDLNVTKTK